MTSLDLELRSKDDHGVAVVELAGELDLTNAGELEDHLVEIGSAAPAALVLDLNRVVFIDSAALNVLFRAARSGARLGLVVGSASPIARTLEIVGLPGVAPTGDSADEVLAALTATPTS